MFTVLAIVILAAGRNAFLSQEPPGTSSTGQQHLRAGPHGEHFVF